MKGGVKKLGVPHDDDVMNDETYSYAPFLQKLQYLILSFDLSKIRYGIKKHVTC